MKWFKHMSNASDDSFIEALEEKFGLEGYARWWKLLEVIALSVAGDCYAEHSSQKWCRFLRLKQNKLSLFLTYLEDQGKINTQETGNLLRVYCPKMLELSDEWRSRKNKNSGVTREKLGPRIDIEVEVEVDKKKEKKEKEKKEKLVQTRFGEFWEIYPSRKNKAKARSIWEREKLDRIADQIITAVQRYKASPNWLKEDGAYVPHPTTFLNGKRWEDEISVTTAVVTPRKPTLLEKLLGYRAIRNRFDGSIIPREELETPKDIPGTALWKGQVLYLPDYDGVESA